MEVLANALRTVVPHACRLFVYSVPGDVARVDCLTVAAMNSVWEKLWESIEEIEPVGILSVTEGHKISASQAAEQVSRG